MAEADSLSSKKRQMYGGELVTLKIGEDKVTVHKVLLEDNSPFFKAAFEKQKQWKESESGVIELPDAHAEVTACVDYLYTKALNIDPDKDGDPDYPHLARLYGFGEKILDDDFCDSVMSTLVTGCAESRMSPGSDPVSIIYAGTPAGSPARDFLVTDYAQNLGKRWSFPAEQCPEFMVDLVLKMAELRPVPGPKPDWKNEKEKWMKVKPKKVEKTEA